MRNIKVPYITENTRVLYDTVNVGVRRWLSWLECRVAKKSEKQIYKGAFTLNMGYLPIFSIGT